jgi:hypothetical protein
MINKNLKINKIIKIGKKINRKTNKKAIIKILWLNTTLIRF